MGKIRKGYETWLENLVGRGNFGDWCIDGSTILKWILQK
jgi:hypothetical protein